MPKRYQSPKGRHRHQCWECSAIWEHADGARFNPASHRCPLCGARCITRYEGAARPQFHDHHVTPAADPEAKGKEE